MLTAEQIAAGRAARRALHRAEKALAELHDALAAVVAAFRPQLPDDDFVALGGGTPKTPPGQE